MKIYITTRKKNTSRSPLVSMRPMQALFTRIVLWMALFGVATFNESTFAQVLEFFGTVEYEVFLKSTNVPPLKCNFQLKSSDSGWLLETSDESDLRPKSRYLFNGEKLFFETDWTTTKLQITNNAARPSIGVRKADVGTPPLINQQFYIHPADAIPAFSADLAFPVWLTFLAARHFTTNSISPFPDWVAMRSGVMLPDEPKIEARVQPYQSNFLSPASIEFYNKGIFVQHSDGQPNVLRPYPPPFDKGFVVAQYNVLQWGQIRNYQYPLQAKLEVFNPQRPREDDPLPLHLTIRTTVTTKTVRESKDLVLPSTPVFHTNAPAPAYVKDYTQTTRLGSAISYRAKSSFLKKTDASFQQVMRDNTKRAEIAQELSQRRQPKPRGLIWTILLAIAIAPLAVVLLQKQKPKKKGIGNEYSK